MKILSVKVPDTLDAGLAALAQRRGISKSALVREAAEAVLTRKGAPKVDSVLALAKDLAGCVTGPVHLTSNPRHLCGYGR